MGNTISKKGVFVNICESEKFYKDEKNIQTTGYLNIEYLLNTWHGNYFLLDTHPLYIHWLFPNSFYNFVIKNKKSDDLKVLLESSADLNKSNFESELKKQKSSHNSCYESFFTDELIVTRYIKSIIMMYDFYGLKINNFGTGSVTKYVDIPFHETLVKPSFFDQFNFMHNLFKDLGAYDDEDLCKLIGTGVEKGKSGAFRSPSSYRHYFILKSKIYLMISSMIEFGFLSYAQAFYKNIVRVVRDYERNVVANNFEKIKTVEDPSTVTNSQPDKKPYSNNYRKAKNLYWESTKEKYTILYSQLRKITCVNSLLFLIKKDISEAISDPANRKKKKDYRVNDVLEKLKKNELPHIVQDLKSYIKAQFDKSMNLFPTNETQYLTISKNPELLDYRHSPYYFDNQNTRPKNNIRKNHVPLDPLEYKKIFLYTKTGLEKNEHVEIFFEYDDFIYSFLLNDDNKLTFEFLDPRREEGFYNKIRQIYKLPDDAVVNTINFEYRIENIGKTNISYSIHKPNFMIMCSTNCTQNPPLQAEFINYYGALIMKRCLDYPFLPKTFVFPIEAITYILNPDEFRKNFMPNLNLLQFTYIFLPFLDGERWTLVCIDLEFRRVEVLDSAEHQKIARSSPWFERVQRYGQTTFVDVDSYTSSYEYQVSEVGYILLDILYAHYSRQINVKETFSRMLRGKEKFLPKEKEPQDSGVYVCQFMERKSVNADLAFHTSSKLSDLYIIKFLRENMMCEVYRNGLINHPIKDEKLKNKKARAEKMKRNLQNPVETNENENENENSGVFSYLRWW